MTYNISGRKQNLTLQRCNCTPYLKRDIDIPANCTIISEKTFQNRSMIQSVSFPYETDRLKRIFGMQPPETSASS